MTELAIVVGLELFEPMAFISNGKAYETSPEGRGSLWIFLTFENTRGVQSIIMVTIVNWHFRHIFMQRSE